MERCPIPLSAEQLKLCPAPYSWLLCCEVASVKWSLLRWNDNWFVVMNCTWDAAKSSNCVKWVNLILSLGNFRMDPGLSTFFCLVWICIVTYCQVLWPQDVGYWKSELHQSCNHLLPKIFCHLYRSSLHICSSWVSLNVLILGTVGSLLHCWVTTTLFVHRSL